jgi:SSS family solute:Na+ symporter
MGLTTAIILATILIISATLIPTFILSHRKKTSEADWAIANRELPIYVVVGTQFASVFGGGIMVGHLGNAYANGIGVFVYGIFMVLPFVFLSLIARWLRENQFATIPDILKKYTNDNKTIVVLSGIMTMLFPIGWITSQITAFGSIYSSLTGLDYTTLCIIFSVVSLLFVMPSGLKTVAWTDFLFACFMGIILIVSLLYGTNMAGGVSTIKATVDPTLLSFSGSIGKLGLSTIWLWFFSILPGGMTNQMYYQRICAIDSEKKVRKSLIISAVVSLIGFCWAVYMGITINSLNNTLDKSMATGWFMSKLPVVLVAFFAATLFAAMMSTLDSAVQSMAVNITHDIAPIVKPDITEKQSLNLNRVVSVLIVAFSLIMCLKFTDTLTWLVAMNAFSAATLFCPIFLGYALRKKNFVTVPGIAAGMVLGAVGTAIGMIMKTVINYAAVGILFSLVGMLIVCAATQKRTQKSCSK